MEEVRLEERHPLGLERLTPNIAGYWWSNERQEDGLWVYDVWRVKDARTAQSIKADIDAQINAETDRKILMGYTYQDMSVWLSSENQFNFKAMFDLAAQTGGATLPIKAKMGDKKGKPVYHIFDTLDDFMAFYQGAIAHIAACLNEGWMRKDAIQVVI